MSNAIRRIENSISKMKVLGSRLSTFFLILFVLNAVLFVICLALEMVRRVTGVDEGMSLAQVLALVSMFLEFLVYGAILYTMKSIARDVAKGKRPFSDAHVKQIRSIAWLFVLTFLVGVLCSPNVTSVVQASVVNIGVASDQVANYFFFDTKSCIGAIVAFSLSSLWRYGALLQAEADDYL